jgi:hypothetical protein
MEFIKNTITDTLANIGDYLFEIIIYGLIFWILFKTMINLMVDTTTIEMLTSYGVIYDISVVFVGMLIPMGLSSFGVSLKA